jgi:hypothetical protein
MLISIEAPSPQQPKSNNAAFAGRFWAGPMGCLSREVLINRGWLSGRLVIAGQKLFAPPGSEVAETRPAQTNQPESKAVPAGLRPLPHGRAAVERSGTTVVERMQDMEPSTAASRRGLRDDLEDG